MAPLPNRTITIAVAATTCGCTPIASRNGLKSIAPAMPSIPAFIILTSEHMRDMSWI